MSVTCQLQRLIFPPWPRPNRRIPVKSGRGLARKSVTFLVGTGRDFKISYKAFRGGVRTALGYNINLLTNTSSATPHPKSGPLNRLLKLAGQPCIDGCALFHH